MRLFIAINFTEATKSRLLALRDELRCRSQRGNFSKPENLHLTVAFLGECEAKMTAAAKKAMDSPHFEPFSFSIDRIGCFRRRGGELWWAGVRECKELTVFQRELSGTLAAAGFEPEAREYKAHITLGREIITGEAPWEIEPFEETVTAIDLMKSERIAGKLTHTSIHRRV